MTLQSREQAKAEDRSFLAAVRAMRERRLMLVHEHVESRHVVRSEPECPICDWLESEQRLAWGDR